MRTAPSLLLAVLLAGCAGYGAVRPGVSTEAELRGSMGAPAAEFAHGDGSRTLAYPYGPLGTQTYMADLAPNGVVRAVRPVLNDDTFQSIQPGMTQEQVLRMIGPPGETMGFSRQRHVAWDYRYVDTWGYRAIFSVTFDRNGIVVSKISQRIERDKGFF